LIHAGQGAQLQVPHEKGELPLTLRRVGSFSSKVRQIGEDVELHSLLGVQRPGFRDSWAGDRDRARDHGRGRTRMHPPVLAGTVLIPSRVEREGEKFKRPISGRRSGPWVNRADYRFGDRRLRGAILVFPCPWTHAADGSGRGGAALYRAPRVAVCRSGYIRVARAMPVAVGTAVVGVMSCSFGNRERKRE
jgi:hypothetical protein